MKWLLCKNKIINNLMMSMASPTKTSRGLAVKLSALRAWPFTPFLSQAPMRIAVRSPRSLPGSRG